MLIIFKVFEFSYVKAYLMPDQKSHPDEIVRKSKGVYQTEERQ